MTATITLDLETLSACPVCGSADYAPYRLVRWGGATMFYYACNNCGVFFLNPRMTDEQTTAYYQGEYRDSLQVINQSATVISEQDLHRQRERAAKQMELAGDLFDGCKTSLEIGCSAGYLMDQLYQIGITPVGVEPDERYHEIAPANQFELVNDVSWLDEDRKYDLICMSHSLEHFNHPREFIRSLWHYRSHANTRFMIEVPNAQKDIVGRIHHPFGFTAYALDWLMAQVGYKPILTKYHGLWDVLPHYLLSVYERG